MSTRFPLFILAFLILLGVPSAQAWNPTGHLIVASLAYDQLSPDARARWAELLKSHPDSDKWLAAAPKDSPGFDLGRYLFMRASTWPDDIRKSGSPWDHPFWHHVDYPLHAPDYPLEPPPANLNNSLTALAERGKVLGDPAAPPTDRAASLSWIIHIVGDLQQPLHSANVIDAIYPAPSGDHNAGNRFVRVAGSPISLHWLWDCLPGDFTDGPKIIACGVEIAGRFPRSSLPELTQASDPKSWSLEGRQLAIDAAYRRGAVVGGTDAAAADLPSLPDGYLAAARALAERRIALGGYRLADTLNGLKTAP